VTEILTVTQVNQRARLLLEASFARVTVLGEVSNFKVVSGHHYFTLKDAGSQLPAVLFKREAALLKFRVADGLEVVATGRLTLYAPYGKYQLVVDRLEPRGAGALQASFQELKQKLASEGLFDASRKRALPLVPGIVAVVTSPTGAVIRDIIHVATRRFPKAQILVIPTRVQGADSAEELAAAIQRTGALADKLGLDLMIVARGGGSLEDLWAFNDERVARALAAAPIPVVTGIGHETDYTIADFVADRRAPTPSAAAELVFPRHDELLDGLTAQRARLGRAMRRDVEHRRLRLRAVSATLGDGRGLIATQLQRLGDSQAALERGLAHSLHGRRMRLGRLETQLARHEPKARLHRVQIALENAGQRLERGLRQQLARRRDRLQSFDERLSALSPLAVLDRGYAIVLGPDQHVVRDPASVRPGDALDIRVARGHLGATVTTDDGNEE
jgi:exodeoxyribonuclease VII large subunit